MITPIKFISTDGSIVEIAEPKMVDAVEIRKSIAHLKTLLTDEQYASMKVDFNFIMYDLLEIKNDI